MELRDVLMIISVGISLAAFAFTVIDRGKKRFDDLRRQFREMLEPLEGSIDAIRNITTSLDKRVAVAESQMAIFWKGVGYSAASVLHSPHTPELDKLLEGFVEETLIPMERLKLQSLLVEVSSDTTETPFRKYLAREVLLCMAVISHFETFPLPNLGHLVWWKDHGTENQVYRSSAP